jgi:hypothetical protein
MGWLTRLGAVGVIAAALIPPAVAQTSGAPGRTASPGTGDTSATAPGTAGAESSNSAAVSGAAGAAATNGRNSTNLGAAGGKPASPDTLRRAAPGPTTGSGGPTGK